MRPCARHVRLPDRPTGRGTQMTGSQNMKVNGVAIDDTFAEAFGMSGTALIITADTQKWPISRRRP